MIIMNRLILLLVAVIFGQSASASLVLDQEHWTSDISAWSRISDGAEFGKSQTFTVGLDGLLHSIDVQHTQGGEFTVARILATAGGIPIGGRTGSLELARSSSVSNIGGTFTFNFINEFLAVNVGDVLAIELFGTSSASWVGQKIFEGTGPTGYASGGGYFFNSDFRVSNWEPTSFDHNFRTYIVSEPVSLVLFSLGLAGILMQTGKRESRFPR